MASIEATLGNTVKSFPALDSTRSQKVKSKIRRILIQTVKEVLKRLEIRGKDYNDQTGKLRSSWRMKRLRGYRYEVSNRTKYASFIEYGTRYITPRRMLRREMANGRARLRRRLRRLNDKVLRNQV